MTLATPSLEHIADLRVEVSAPVEAGRSSGLNSRGRRRIIPITGGLLSGPQLRGRVLPGGADFQMVVSDTCADLDARHILELDSPGRKVNTSMCKTTPCGAAARRTLPGWCGVKQSTLQPSISAAC